MSDADKPEVRQANDNPFYCLATLHGEQAVHYELDSGDRLAAKNREAWNRLSAGPPLSDEDRTELVKSGFPEKELVPLNVDEMSAFYSAFAARWGRDKGLPPAFRKGLPPWPTFTPDFSHTHFDRVVDFNGFLFLGVKFVAATFSSIASFNKAKFSGPTDFGGATFSRVADFSGATFSRDANFGAATFSAYANFGAATFSGNANFIGATFSDYANFSEATFSGEADLEAATFSGKADFKAATFSRVNFFEATFSEYANFTSTTFSGNADFGAVTFSGNADFGRARFSGIAMRGDLVRSLADLDSRLNKLDRTREGCNFSRATFSSLANFRAATFSSSAIFINAKCAAHTIFDRARFETHVPDFRGATMHEATEWHDVSWPKPPNAAGRRLRWHLDHKAEAQAQIYAYERLKQEMERLKKHEDEQKFFRKELRARRELVPILSPSWLLNAAYQASSDYGNSFSRPLLSLGAVFGAGIAIFTQVPLCAGEPMPFKLAARLSFANIFIFLNDKRELTAMPEMKACLSNTTAAVSAVQSVSGVVLLFLLILALRNRFRMRGSS